MELSLVSIALFLAAFVAGAAVAWLFARERLARLETALEHERRTAVEKLRLLEDAQTRLGDTFKALSSEALQGNNASFLHLARATLEPLRDSLDKVDRKIQEIETARAAAYAGLTEHLRSLGAAQASLERETVKLVGALRAPAARGRWGEIQLQRVVISRRWGATWRRAWTPTTALSARSRAGCSPPPGVSRIWERPAARRSKRWKEWTRWCGGTSPPISRQMTVDRSRFSVIAACFTMNCPDSP